MAKKENISNVSAPDYAITADGFKWVGENRHDMEGISRPSLSFWQDGLRRLMRDKKAVFCVIVLIIVIIGVIVLPMVSGYSISEQHLDHVNKPMFFTAEDGHMHIFGTDDLGRDIWSRVWDGGRTSLIIAFTAVGACLFIGVVYAVSPGTSEGLWITS